MLWRTDKAALTPLLSTTEQSRNSLARLHAFSVLDGHGDPTK